MQKKSLYGKQAVSVDCAVFGFDGRSLNVLLVRRKHSLEGDSSVGDYKLPGSLIAENEDLSSAVLRVMEKHIGVRNIYMRQMDVLSDPERITGIELEWLNEYYNSDVSRVITVTYYSLVKLDERLINFAAKKGVKWVDVNSVKRLALDHNDILIRALDCLATQFQQEPLAYELLPKRFTIRALMTLCEAVLGFEFDKRNFRKKILSSGYIVPTGEKEVGVAHKPAMYYAFDKKIYARETKTKLNLKRW